MTDNTDAPKKDTSIVGWLNRQKEVIVLIMFFAGGVVFLYLNFVTQEQVRRLQCTLQTHTKIMAKRAEREELQRLNRIWSDEEVIMSDAEGLTDHEKELLAHLRNSQKAANEEIDELDDELETLNEEMLNC